MGLFRGCESNKQLPDGRYNLPNRLWANAPTLAARQVSGLSTPELWVETGETGAYSPDFRINSYQCLMIGPLSRQPNSPEMEM